MRYILNSAVITAPGRYDYRLLSLPDARRWVEAGPYRSTIRYQDTAAALSGLLGCDVEVRNETITMQPGDEALVFRLVFPPGAGRVELGKKGRLDRGYILGNCEIGLLWRVG